ncbi:hypothetical protein SAMN05421743_10167 [Thalassobacillus cyri]|uniref:Uncharacterized protein n=2 Tax=Thalassobacillus cyri TaxID=571932 RepID=A0A1H3VKX1_9BACI|nr:hypothetical protein SAMN05421743_10167 [Thalassobacillus cyri]
MGNPTEEVADSAEEKDDGMDVASLMITLIFAIAMKVGDKLMDLSFLPTISSIAIYILLTLGLAAIMFKLLHMPLIKMLGKRNKRVPLGYAIIFSIAAFWLFQGINFILTAL